MLRAIQGGGYGLASCGDDWGTPRCKQVAAKVSALFCDDMLRALIYLVDFGGTMINRIALVAIGGMSVLLMLETAGPLLVPTSDPLPAAELSLAHHVENITASADGLVGMLFTSSIGLFAGVGLMLRDWPCRLGSKYLIAPLAFFGLTAVSVYFGFLARMQALQAANFGTAPEQVIPHLIGWQGALVAMSVVPLLVVAYDFFNLRSPEVMVDQSHEN